VLSSPVAAASSLYCAIREIKRVDDGVPEPVLSTAMAMYVMQEG
jgi:hypothetical protein